MNLHHAILAEAARLGQTFEGIAGMKRFHVVIPGSGEGFAQTLAEAEASKAAAEDIIRRHKLSFEAIVISTFQQYLK